MILPNLYASANRSKRDIHTFSKLHVQASTANPPLSSVDYPALQWFAVPMDRSYALPKWWTAVPKALVIVV
jgi:hypothetical protein